MSRIDIVYARLTLEEGTRRVAYNDKTGRTVTCRTPDPATSGNLSIGRGINLEVGLDAVEDDFLFRHRIGLVDAKLAQVWWMAGVDDVRGSVPLDIGYNAGFDGLIHFPKMCAAIGSHNWVEAKAELLNSDAARKYPNRYNALGEILLNG